MRILIPIVAATTAALAAAAACSSSTSTSNPTATPFSITPLVGSEPGAAAVTDSSLRDAWGIATVARTTDISSPKTYVVVERASGQAEGFDEGGLLAPIGGTFTRVVIPAAGTGTSAALSTPTGVVTVDSPSFMIPSGGSSVRASLLFATLDGHIAAWSPALGGEAATLMVTSTAGGAGYTGLAVTGSGSSAQILAANFARGSIDAFGDQFKPVPLTSTSFHDPNIPAGYAPFNVASLDGVIYVTYARQASTSPVGMPGAGMGYVDAFDPSGKLLHRVATGATLNEPWAVVRAPASFGTYGGRLLIGNFGDGTISVIDETDNSARTRLLNASGSPLAIDGLWGLVTGAGGTSSTGSIYFAAGPALGAQGLFGRISPAEAAPGSPTPTPTGTGTAIPTPTGSKTPTPTPTSTSTPTY